jgi:cytochrome c oxidase subunit 4
MSIAKAEQAEHVLPLWLYLTVGVSLIALTGLTVTISFIHFGGWNLVVALGIAAFKASLVLLFFMHLKYDNKLYLVVFMVAILFLSIFIIFTMFDTMERDQIYQIKAQPIRQEAEMYDSLAARAAEHGHGVEHTPAAHDSSSADSTE